MVRDANSRRVVRWAPWQRIRFLYFAPWRSCCWKRTMAIYESQAELSELVPRQWRQFRLDHPELNQCRVLWRIALH